MRWYQFQLRKPKRWARRAKSDGSAIPGLKPKINAKRFGWYRQFQHWLWFVVSVCHLIPALGVFVLITVMQLDLQGVPFSNLCAYLGLPSPWDLMGDWLRGALIASQVGVILLVLSMSRFIMGLRSERKHAIAHRCHLCPRCGYSLQSRTSDDQPCAECGQRISRREAVRLWARFCR
jgi:ABC-type Fe3+ transport system permease subunit